MTEIEGLFSNVSHGRCKCGEAKKPISKRNYTIYSYYPRRVWGKAKEKYDGRKILNITCNKCGCTWRDYNPKSPFWDVLQDTPHSGEEVLYAYKESNVVKKIIGKIKKVIGG